jgi:hypothetical protein
MFVVCAGIVLLGVLFGVPAAAADALLIFSGFFAAGLVIIALAAGRMEELSSFPVLVMSAACLHLATTMAVVRRVILSDGQASRITAVVGERLSDLSGIICGAVFLGVAAVSLVAILAAVRHMRTKAVLNLAVLSGDVLAGNRDAAARVAFNIGMGWAAKYIVLDAVTTMSLLCIGVAGAGVMGTMKTFGAGEEGTGGVAAAVGAGVTMIIPLLAIAVAAAKLMGKDCVLCKARASENVPKQEAQVRDKATPVAPAKEAVFDEPSGIKAEREYQRITDILLEGDAKEAKVVLMAARSSTEMGVTLPVNVAAKMAQKKRRCLIVDMDTSRNAVAKAFNIGTKEGPTKTCISGLYAWGAGSFCDKSASIAKKLEAAQKHFDKTIVYWPGAGQGHEDIVQGIGAAVFCGARGVEMAVLETRLTKRGCVILR